MNNVMPQRILILMKKDDDINGFFPIKAAKYKDQRRGILTPIPHLNLTRKIDLVIIGFESYKWNSNLT